MSKKWNSFPITDYSKLSCILLFKIIFLEDIYEYLVGESNKYVIFCNKNQMVIVKKLK